MADIDHVERLGLVRWQQSCRFLSLAHGWLEDADVLDAMALDDRVLAMTWRLTH